MDAPDALILTCGEWTFQDSLKSVHAQTLRPRQEVVVENVFPAARAAQQGLEELLRRGSRAYVQVDADMILLPNCFETLASHLEAQPDCFQVVGQLEDGIEGPIWGVRIYRPGVISQLGGFRDVAGPDRDLRERAEQQGWNTLTLKDVLGFHNRVYRPEAAFGRYCNKANRLKGLYGMSEKTFRLWHNNLKILVMNYARNQDLPAIAAMAGLFCGILTEGEETLPDSDRRALKNTVAFQQYMEFLSHYTDPSKGSPPMASERNNFPAPPGKEGPSGVAPPSPARAAAGSGLRRTRDTGAQSSPGD